MKIKPLACLIVFAFVAGCASQTGAPGEDEVATVAGKPLVEDYKEDRVICRRQRTAGSHVPVTVCKSESQMKAERGATQETIGPLRPMAGDSRGLDIQTLRNH